MTFQLSPKTEKQVIPYPTSRGCDVSYRQQVEAKLAI